MRVGDPVKIAQQCLMDGTESLFGTFPKSIRSILEERLWEQRTDKHGQPFKRFEDFVKHPLWHGLEIKSLDRLKGYLQDHDDVIRLVEREEGVATSHGGDRRSEEVQSTLHCKVESQPYGNHPSYLLRRLKRDAPDVAEDYLSGQYKSVRAAAIAAGIVKVPTPFDSIAKQLPKLTQDEARRLMELLQQRAGV